MPGRLTFAYLLRKFLRPHGVEAFLQGVPLGSQVLDVGCGDEGSRRVKSQRPDLHYVGLDIVESGLSLAIGDEYHLSTSAGFADAIRILGQRFNAVISTHNLEHCQDPDDVLRAMLGALKSNGRLYLAFPSEASLKFPSRKGTLNFWDDPTHKSLPDFDYIIQIAALSGVSPVYASRSYRPLLSFVLGFLLEPISAITRRCLPLRLTWSFYGFESVIWFA